MFKGKQDIGISMQQSLFVLVFYRLYSLNIFLEKKSEPTDTRVSYIFWSC